MLSVIDLTMFVRTSAVVLDGLFILFMLMVLFFVYWVAGFVINALILYLFLYIRTKTNKRTSNGHDRTNFREQFRIIYMKNMRKIAFSALITGSILLVSIFFLFSVDDPMPSTPLYVNAIEMEVEYFEGEYIVSVSSINPEIIKPEDRQLENFILTIRRPTDNKAIFSGAITELDEVENISFVDREPDGRISVGDSFVIDESFFSRTGRYSFRLHTPDGVNSVYIYVD